MRLSVYAGITSLFLLFQAESGIVFSQQVADSTLREEIVIEDSVPVHEAEDLEVKFLCQN